MKQNSRSTKVSELVLEIDLDIAIDKMVAVHPSNKSSLTYGFLQTSSMNPGNARESTISSTVAQYDFMTLTRREVRKVRIISVIKSPKDDATGVAMLSAINNN